jgi:hypothetical protein
MTIDDIDLLHDILPVGTTIVIEGEGQTVTKEQKRSMFLQITAARAIINKKGLIASTEFLKRIKITEIDTSKRILTVRILPVPGYSRL